MSPEPLDDLNHFVGFVALSAGERDEFIAASDDEGLFGSAADGDAAAAAELEEAFIA
jgi:hypothetical protein